MISGIRINATEPAEPLDDLPPAGEQVRRGGGGMSWPDGQREWPVTIVNTGNCVGLRTYRSRPAA